MANKDIALLVKMLPWLVSHPGRSTKEVAQEFQISPKHVIRLLEMVSFTGPHQYGGGLVEVSLGDGEYITVHDAQSLDRPIRLNAREASALLAGLTYLEKMPALADPIKVGKLMDTISQALDPATPALAVVTPEVERNIIQTIKSGLENNVCVQITYISGSAQNSAVRIIEPKHLSTRDDRTFVRAWCHEAEGVRSFRVDKITRAELLAQPATVELTQDELFADTSSWLPVTLDVMRDYLSEFDADTISSTQDLGSVVRIEAKVANLRWLASVVMSARGGIKVISPVEARSQLHEMALKWKQNND